MADDFNAALPPEVLAAFSGGTAPAKRGRGARLVRRARKSKP